MASPSVKCSDVDLVASILDIVAQVPEGRVSTYGDVARSLGDVRAARAVAEVLSRDGLAGVPRHRVVSADGGVPAVQARFLLEEGVHVDGDKVAGLERLRFTEFRAEPVFSELQREQEELRSLVAEEDAFEDLKSVTGFDVSYRGDMAFAAAVRMRLEDLDVLEIRYASANVRFPYVPGYLGYRELPLVRKVFRAEDDELLLIDGQGVLHPRGFGVACQVGVCLDAPTIGAAKSLLLGSVEGMGARADIKIVDQVRGRMLRPKDRKGIYVSVGHRVSLDSACGICERLMVKGVPEPLRLAHILATQERKRAELGA